MDFRMEEESDDETVVNSLLEIEESDEIVVNSLLGIEESDETVVNSLLDIKWKSGKTYSQLAAETGLTNVYVAQLFRRQAVLKPETAPKLRAALPELSKELLDEMMNPPMLRTYNPALIREPTVYRLKEAVMHFGESIKDIINEDFGDGVMSATDFYCFVDKIKGTDGKDRVVVKFDGNYLPYPEEVDQDWSPVFPINEATIEDIQLAFQQKELTSKQLVQHYLKVIENQQEKLHAVIEVNPDALTLAEKADNDRIFSGDYSFSTMNMIQGIPVLLKDNIATEDKLNTTCGSYALLGSVVPEDAGVVAKLRQAGAIILGKAGLSEWAYFRSSKAPSGWSARGGTVENPYVTEPASAGGSSTGSAVSVAANLVTVSLGTETSGSIMNPCNFNCVVGIKPTVGLTSRSGVIPLTSRQDTVGPIGRTVSDAVYLLDVIVGSDPRDKVTMEAAKYIPPGGYKQFLKIDGLKGKRLGNMWSAYKGFYEPPQSDVFERHIDTLSRSGAVLVNYESDPNFETIMTEINVNMVIPFSYEFKRDLNVYLTNLTKSGVRSLADVIAFNEAHPDLEKLVEYGQDLLIKSEQTKLPSDEYTEIVNKLENGAKGVFEKFMIDNKLDAIVAPETQFSEVVAVLGCPCINVPAGFDDRLPFGILFGGFKGYEGTLIEIAYAFEQATKVRIRPTLR